MLNIPVNPSSLPGRQLFVTDQACAANECAIDPGDGSRIFMSRDESLALALAIAAFWECKDEQAQDKALKLMGAA